MELRHKFTRQMTKGFESRTFTTHFQKGQGFKMKCFSFWKGEESGEESWSDQSWFLSEQECWDDMQKRFKEFEKMGWE